MEIQERVRTRIQRSVARSSDPSRTVPNPDAAALYATNALLHHDTGLLALAAVRFARDEVEALLADDPVCGKGQ